MSCGRLPIKRAALLGLVALPLAGCGKTGPSTSAGSAEATSKPSKTATFLGSNGAGGLSTGSTTRLGGGGPIVDAAAVARALYPGLTPRTRPQAVVIVDERQPAAALAAAGLAAAPLRAPILYSEGGHLPAASQAALAAMRPTGAKALHRAQVIVIGDAPRPAGYTALSLREDEPVALAARIATLCKQLQGGRLSAAIVVNAGSAALSMPAAGLSAESGAPILLAEAGRVPQATSAAIKRLRIGSLYAVGPASAMSEADATSLRRLAPLTRIGAPGVVANAIAVAAFTNGRFGWGVQEPGHGLVFARSSQPLDAPAAAPLSAGADFGPLLLLDRSKGVPKALARYLGDIQPGYGSAPESRPVRGVYNRGWLIGDQEAISLQTQAELDGLLQSVPRPGATTPSLLP